jgi:eukaryotic-like serine/threonine-protein kinase
MSDSASRPLRAGDRIVDRYLLLRPLRERRSGGVWIAHDEALDVHVVMKFSFVPESTQAARLVREARTAARIGNHPGILRVFGLEQTERGERFMVTELLEGETLATALDRDTRWEPLRGMRTLLPVCSALGAAHAAGVIHRDLSPGNVFLALGADGRLQPKIVGFGAARPRSGSSARVTQKNVLVGTLDYMSPEQVRALDVDQRGDVWSLCATLFRTVTGRPPFEGATHQALMRSITHDEPPTLVALGIAEPALSDIIGRGLRKDPDKRWQSARELGVALTEWLLASGAIDDASGTALRPSFPSVRMPSLSNPGVQDIVRDQRHPVLVTAPISGASESPTQWENVPVQTLPLGRGGTEHMAPPPQPRTLRIDPDSLPPVPSMEQIAPPASERAPIAVTRTVPPAVTSPRARSGTTTAALPVPPLLGSGAMKGVVLAAAVSVLAVATWVMIGKIQQPSPVPAHAPPAGSSAREADRAPAAAARPPPSAPPPVLEVSASPPASAAPVESARTAKQASASRRSPPPRLSAEPKPPAADLKNPFE